MPQANEELLLEWEPITEYEGPDGLVIPVRGPVVYSIGKGQTWAMRRHVECTPCPYIRTKNWCPGTEQYWISAKLPSDHWSKPAGISVTMANPPTFTDVDAQNHKTLNWPGTKTGTEQENDPGSKFDDGLVLSAGNASGTYESGQIDMGFIGEWRIAIQIVTEYARQNFTWAGFDWTKLSGTWADIRAGTATIAGFPFERWNQFAWNSEWAQETDWTGQNIYNPTASALLEFRVYDADGNPGSVPYGLHREGVYLGRYFQFRLTLARNSTADDVVGVTTCIANWANPNEVAGPTSAPGDVELAVFDGTSGKKVKSGGVTVSDLSPVAHTHALTSASITGVLPIAKGGTNISDLTGGALGLLTVNTGETGYFVTRDLFEPFLRKVGQTNAQRTQFKNANQGGAGNIAEMPNLSAVGGQTAQFLMSTAASVQETRNLRLVDTEFKRNGQTAPFAKISSADQTGAATFRIPDLGDASTHDAVVTNLSGQAFTYGLTINSGGNDSDTVIQGDTLTYLFNADAGANKIGINATTTDLTHMLVIQNAVDGKCLRLIGHGATYGHLGKINFGDGDFVKIEEDADDKLLIYAAGTGGRITLWPNASAGVRVAQDNSQPTHMLEVAGEAEVTGLAVLHKVGTDTKEGVVIASGVAAITKTNIELSPEGGGADALDKITGGQIDMIILVACDGAAAITFKHNNVAGADGTIFMNGDADVTVDNDRRVFAFQRFLNGSNYAWRELGHQ